MKHPKNYFLDHEGLANNFSQIKKNCKTCNNEFMIQKHRENTAKYCSKKCTKGYKFSKETKEKMSISKTGDKHPNFGKKASKELVDKLKKSHIGCSVAEKNPNWKGGSTKIGNRIRQISKYFEWRESIFIRDKFTCVWCGASGVELNADHIIPFSKIIRNFKIISFEDAFGCNELWDIDNGRTLCLSCHKKTDTYGNKLKS